MYFILSPGIRGETARTPGARDTSPTHLAFFVAFFLAVLDPLLTDAFRVRDDALGSLRVAESCDGSDNVRIS